MDSICHGELLDLRLTLWHPYLLIESMTYPSSASEHGYDSDSDLEDDEGEQSEELKPQDAESSGKV